MINFPVNQRYLIMNGGQQDSIFNKNLGVDLNDSSVNSWSV